VCRVQRPTSAATAEEGTEARQRPTEGADSRSPVEKRQREGGRAEGGDGERRGPQTLVISARRVYDASMVKLLKSAKGQDGDPLLVDGCRSSRRAGSEGRCKEALALAGGASEGRMGTTTSREEAVFRGKKLLQQRLDCLRMDMVAIEDDGNCQFRAISRELFGSQGKHSEIRRVAVAHMKRRPEEFRVFFDKETDWQEYVHELLSPGSWGDELTLRAVADAFRVKIHVVTSQEENWYLQYAPKGQTPVRELFLSYISPIHYNTLAPTCSF